MLRVFDSPEAGLMRVLDGLFARFAAHKRKAALRQMLDRRPAERRAVGLQSAAASFDEFGAPEGAFGRSLRDPPPVCRAGS